MKHVRPAVLLATAALLITGCSSSDSSPDEAASATPSDTTSTTSATTTATPSPTATATAAAINPCDGLDAAAVSRALGAGLTKETGSTAAPRCALLPKKKGGPTFEMSYTWLDVPLAEAWKTMQIPAGRVTSPKIPGADDARLVVNASKSAYAVSAFLQNGTLVQTLNALALPPYDGPAVLRATKVILRQLSAARSA